MAIVRFDPFSEVGLLQNQMGRLMDTVFDQGTTGSMMRQWVPPMDLVEQNGEYVVKADLPGLDEGDINIEMQDNILTISGERRLEKEDETGDMYRIERAYGAFTRSLVLPQGVDPKAIDATFERGVLEVHVPKPSQKSPKKISVKRGTQRTIEGSPASAGEKTKGKRSRTGAASR